MPADGSWSEKKTTLIRNRFLPQIYYFVTMDCEHNTHGKIRSMPKIEVEFDIQTKHGPELDHFSYEEEGSLGMHFILLIFFTGIFGLTIRSYIQYHKVYEKYTSPHFIMLIGIFFHMGGIFM